MVAGVYLHGLFEDPAARRAVIDWLAARRGLHLEAGLTPTREDEYDRLARSVRRDLDLAAVYRLVEQGG